MAGKVFYNGRNAEHRYYAFEVASANSPDYALVDQVAAWCAENLPQVKGKRPRYLYGAFSFKIFVKADADAFRQRWCS